MSSLCRCCRLHVFYRQDGASLDLGRSVKASSPRRSHEHIKLGITNGSLGIQRYEGRTKARKATSWKMGMLPKDEWREEINTTETLWISLWVNPVMYTWTHTARMGSSNEANWNILVASGTEINRDSVSSDERTRKRQMETFEFVSWGKFLGTERQRR